MSAGQWTNADGLPLNFGTNKALSELGGDYLAYGDTREVETYINFAPTYWSAGSAAGTPTIPTPISGATFNGTGTPAQAGIVSMTTLFPLQTVANGFSTAGGSAFTGNASGVFLVNNSQLWIDSIELEVLSTFNAGASGTCTSFAVGLVTWSNTSNAWVQVTPNTGVQVMGTAVVANLVAGKHWVWMSDGSVFGSASASAPTAGSWLGNVPLVTNAIVPLPTNAFFAVQGITATSTVAGSGAGGLARLRVHYNIYGNITQ
jgi:hypothetical protein